MSNSIPASTLEKFTTFGDLLRFLRRRTGLTQLELSIAVGYSDAQISRLEQNLRLPDIPTIQARFVPVLDLEDEPNAVARLLELAANIRREDAPGLGLCPYKGLNYFDEADADLFVGREALTAKLTERVLSLHSSRAPDKTRFLAVVGASGSGKSSLVRAGLVPALRWNKASGDWNMHILTPTTHPLESLAMCLTQENGSVGAAAGLIDDLARDTRSLHLFAKREMKSMNGIRLLLVVDQFEEVFALCRSEEERTAYIGNLVTAASEAAGPTVLVITLRADFYAHCAGYIQLREALARQQEYIGTMSDDELRRAIEEPARRGRWEVEPGLVDLLLHDVGHEPGALPLLSHALLETWQRRRGRTMTLSGYTASGGVRGAIAETAEAVFADQFSPEQKTIARRIFLRLTELGDQTATGDTRRRATLNELILRPEETATTQAVLTALADARLITTDADSVEVAHEALIREWPTLRGWLEDNREGLRLHRHLTEAAQAWQAMGREPGELYRGTRLAQAVEWADQPENSDALNALEQAFLEASRKSEAKGIAEREAQRQRELETERQRAEEQAQSAARLRRRALYLVGVALIALLMAGTAFAFANRNASLAVQNAANANFASTQQAIAEAEADGRATQQALAESEAKARATAEVIALQERDLTQAQRLAAEANNLMLNNGDPNLIALLSIQSLNKQYTPAGDAMLANLTTQEVLPLDFSGHTADILGVDFSPDGKYLVTVSRDRTARLWEVATGETIRTFQGQTGEAVYFGDAAFSPDGKYLLTSGGPELGDQDKTARLWDVASGQLVQVFSAEGAAIEGVAYSPDGKYFASAGGADQTARIWDVATGQILHILTGHSNSVVRLAFSPDGRYVLTASLDRTARLWDVGSGREVRVFTGHADAVNSVAFSPDGQSIATGSDDGIARVWEANTGQVVREFIGGGPVKFSPDGRFLLTGGADGTIQLWDIDTGKTIRVISGNRLYTGSAAFSPDGRLVATAGGDRLAKVWSMQSSSTVIKYTEHTRPVKQASFLPDGKRVVTASDDSTARIWDAATGQTLITLSGHSGAVNSAVFSEDGKLVLTAGEDATVRLWDAASGEELRRFEGHTDIVFRAVFSPDGKFVVSAGWDGTARVWDAQTAEKLRIYTNQGPGHVNRVAFSPDGKSVVTSADDGTARIWDPLTGKDLMVFKGHKDIVAGVAFSPDGKYVLTGSLDSSVRLWDVASGKEVRRFAGHPGGSSGVAFSPDGKTVLSGGYDGTVRLWDVQTGQEVRRFTGHTNIVRNVAFSPDGKYILTASEDFTARLWLFDYHDTIRAVCALLTRDLTAEERAQFGINDEEPTCPNS